MTAEPKRHLLIVASQCRAMPYLDGLHDAAAQLSRRLLDPALGGCVPALPDGVALLGGRQGDEHIPSDTIRAAIAEAAQRAAAVDEGATLVLALLGHGFTPGASPSLYMMGADSIDQDRRTGVYVAEALNGAADQTGINGVIALVDTCSAAAAVPLAFELTTGVRGGQARLAVLAASGATQDAYDLRFSRTLADVLDTGISTAPPTLTVAELGRALDRLIPGQNIIYNEYGGGLAKTESLWLARNRRALMTSGSEDGRGPAAVPASAPVQVERPDDRSYHNMCASYTKWAAGEWRFIDLGDLGVEQGAQEASRVRRLRLQKMYISLQADPRSVSDRQREEQLRQLDLADLDADAARTVSSRQNIDSIVAVGPRAAADTDSTGEGGISLEDAFDGNRMLVVLGHPGSGKSVMCLWLGFTLAGQSLKLLRAGAAGPLRIPMRFRAADYAKFYGAQFANGDRPGGIAQFLASSLPAEVDYPAHKLQGMFERALADGEAVLLIDGLDELTAHRNEVIDALFDAVETHIVGDRSGRNQAVITSRIHGYDDVYIALDDVAHYIIRPMSGEQITGFVTRFFTEIRRADQAPEFLQRLEQSSPAIRRLATTPLLLTSMCSYWHRHYELPASRPKLYRQLLMDTAFRWRTFAEGQSTLETLLGNERDFMAMLSRIAVHIHEENVDGRISEDELLETLDDALFGAEALTGEDSRSVGPELIDRIRDKIGILAEFSPGEFGFIHQTFREYLTGLDLLYQAEGAGPGGSGRRGALGGPGGSDAESDRALYLAFRERVGDPRWREPVLLAMGECGSGTRVALMRHVVEGAEPDLEDWADLFLAAALERPVAETTPAELTLLLGLAMRTVEEVRTMPDLLEDLDARIAELRRHIGRERFDFLALSLFAEDGSLTAPVAALYWRRQWLTAAVLEAFAAAAHRDSAEWEWPIHRALRLAAGPDPLRTITILGKLDRPVDGDTSDSRDALRLFELGRRAWERQRQLSDEATVEALPAGVLPLRELFMDRPERWEACMADLDCARVLCALFGGLDHHDALRWSAEYEDFARLLNLPDRARQAEIERRAADLVPRFGLDDAVYSIAVSLDTVGRKVTRQKPVPAIDVMWLTCPSTPAVRGAAHRWLNRAPGDPALLRQALEQLARPESDPADRAEAELGLLVLDGRPMTADAASVRALERCLESTGDAMIRGHEAWFTAVWDSSAEISQAERATMHRFLLRLAFLVAGRPVPLLPGPQRLTVLQSARHPILDADAVARIALARSWGEESSEELGLENHSAEQTLAVMAWLTTLPYRDSTDRLGEVDTVALWHEEMPRAVQSLPGGLAAALHSVLTWAHRQAPHLEPQISIAARVALLSYSSPLWRQSTDALPKVLGELYELLATGRGTADLQSVQSVRRLAEELPGSHADLAYLLIALSCRAPEHQQAQWQSAALDFLADEPDQALLAEALYRVRDYFCADPTVHQQAADLIATITSPVLRANAVGDLGQSAEALIGLVGAQVGRAETAGLLTVARVMQELSRIARAAPAHDLDHTVSLGQFLAGMADHYNLTDVWFLVLDRALLATITSHLAENPDDGETLAQLMSVVSRVDDDAVAGLTALLEQAEPDERWAASARNLLALQRSGTDERRVGNFRELAEMVLTADAATAAKASLLLLGPYRAGDRGDRHYRLSEYGLASWWELGGEAVAEANSRREQLFQLALYEWDVDDAAAVREAARRSTQGALNRTIWLRLLATASIWRDEAQLALADWLDGVGADRAVADTSLDLLAILSTSRSGVAVAPELYAAVARSAVRAGAAARTVSGLSAGELRLEVAETVALACLHAVNEGAVGQAAVDAARSHFWESTHPVVSLGADGTPQVDVDGYGSLFWTKLGARPEDVAKFTPSGLGDERAITLLCGWLRELEAEGAGRRGSAPLAYVCYEAILNLLVVLSARVGPMFKLCCPPETMQPVFSRAVLRMGGVGASAGLILLSRLRFVDLAPAEGPDLVEVMDGALLGPPLVHATVFDFVTTVRHIRGASIAGVVLDRIRQSPNESVAQGFAGLAAAYLLSPNCSSADRRLIRHALLAEINETGRRRPVKLMGTGSTSDPITPIIGQDRRSEFRRLLRRS